MTDQPEPPDEQQYYAVWFNRDTVEFFISSARFYESLLAKDIESIDLDPDLKVILHPEQRKSLPVFREAERATRIRDWLDSELKKSSDPYEVSISMSHGIVRYLKSTSALYLRFLNQRRAVLAARPNVSRHALATVDQQITGLTEKTKLGVFKNASPLRLLADEGVPSAATPAAPTENSLATQALTRPVVIDSIQILDEELSARCLDLFEAFRADGKQDRLDTVLSEATRVLEDRLRKLSGAPATCVGPDLAAYCFAGPKQRLIVSSVAAEQDAAHLLFRGVFGFIRNRVHHSIVSDLQPDRVLQVVGLIDYL